MNNDTDHIVLYESQWSKVQLENGLIVMRITPNYSASVDDAEQYIQLLESMHGQMNGPFPMMTIVNGLLRISKEARRVLRRFEQENFMTAHAILAGRPSLAGMMKFITFLVPSEFPEEVFTNENNAREWLMVQTKANGGTWPEEEALKRLRL